MVFDWLFIHDELVEREIELNVNAAE